jgi:hypothetical protein
MGKKINELICLVLFLWNTIDFVRFCTGQYTPSSINTGGNMLIISILFFSFFIQSVKEK